LQVTKIFVLVVIDLNIHQVYLYLQQIRCSSLVSYHDKWQFGIFKNTTTKEAEKKKEHMREAFAILGDNWSKLSMLLRRQECSLDALRRCSVAAHKVVYIVLCLSTLERRYRLVVRCAT